MAAVSNIGNWLSPSSVSIFAQPPGTGFAAFLLVQASFPSAKRVRLDLAESEDHERSFQVTRNPMEKVVAQNKIRNPDTLNVTGMLSAHPLVSPVSQFGLARLDKRALLQLRQLVTAEDLLFVVTPERYLPNMICTRMREHYDDTTGVGVRLTLSFVEAQIISPGLVSSVFDADEIGVGASQTSDLGPQSTTTVADPGGLG